MATLEKHEVPVKIAKSAEKMPARVLSPFDEFERFFDQLAPRGWLSPLRWERPLMPDLSALEARLPKLDVIDRDDEVIVKAEIPGVKKEDLHVSLTGNMMTIKGETKTEEKEEKGDYYRCEISRGSFARSVMLPAEVDDSKAKAEMKDGVLEITLPKLEQAKKRDIKIG
jgi:HSP20 family protein